MKKDGNEKNLTDILINKEDAPETQEEKPIKKKIKKIEEEISEPILITREMIDAQNSEKTKKEVSMELEGIIDSMDDKLQEEENLDVDIYAEGEIKNTTYQTTTEKRVRDVSTSDTYQDINENDFMPSYGDHDEEEDKDVEDEAANTDKEEDSGIDFSKMPVIQHEHNPKSDEVFANKTKNIRIVTSKNPNLKNVGDQAFINSINKYRKNVGKTTAIPLINSGFIADMIGGGILDLALLYSSERDKNEIDYELDKMKTIINSVVGTTPSIKREALASAIHFVDYQLMSFGYVCGTLSEIVIPHTCYNKNCSTNFKISADPKDTILNLDEISNNIAALNDVTIDNYHDKSLLGYVKDILFEKGIKVTLGHPSYMDMVMLLNNIKYVTNKNSSEGAKYAKLLTIISFIRRLILPGGEMSVNGYQIFKGLSLLDEEEFNTLSKSIKEENDRIVQPKFGIKSVKCPVCGTINNDIEIQNLDDLVFFHIMATQQTN